MLVSTHLVYFQHYAREDLVAVDTSRIAASAVTGVGFLGGGAILRTGLSVQGLTTAARGSPWRWTNCSSLRQAFPRVRIEPLG